MEVNPRVLLIGVAVIALVAVVFWRRGSAPNDVVTPVQRSATKTTDRVRERLDQIRANHAHGGMGVASGNLQAHSGFSTGGTTMHGPRGAEPRAQQNAGAADDGDSGDGDDGSQLDADADDIPTLKTIALQDPNPERRLSAVTLLGSSDDPELIPVLAQVLSSDQDEETRMAALESLSDFSDDPPVEAIESALNDSSADIRFEALSILSDIGGEQSRGAIERALNDSDEEVRTLAEGLLDMEELYEPTPGDAQAVIIQVTPPAMP